MILKLRRSILNKMAKQPQSCSGYFWSYNDDTVGCLIDVKLPCECKGYCKYALLPEYVLKKNDRFSLLEV